MFDRKIIKVILLITLCLFIFLADQFTNNIYDLNIFEYLKYTAAITDDERAYLDGKNIIYHASDKNAPPFTFLDKNNGQYKGLVIDYISALSIELEVDMDFVPKVWNEALASVISGETDMTELIPSSERAEYFLFSNSIYTFRSIILTLKGQTEIAYAKNLSGHRVAIQSGDYANEYIAENVPGVDVVNTTDVLEAIMLLNDGKVDAVIGDEPVVAYFMGQLGIEDDVDILNPPLYERDICLGVKKSDQKLLTILNKGILNLKQKDFVQKIQQKWLGLSEPIQNDRMSARFLLFFMSVIVILIIFFMVMILWSYTLRSEVRKRTHELDKSRKDLQMTFDAMSDFLVVVSKEGTVENANKSFCQWISMNRTELLGRCCMDLPLLCMADINVSENHVSEAKYNGRHYMLYITPLVYEDNRVLIVIEDDTDKIITQQQMLQQNKMIAVGQLASGIAHEIRNPLGLIRNYSYVLKGKLKNQDQLMEKSISIIESSVLRAGRMVDNLLNFSRISGHERRNINLLESLKEIISFESKKISEKNINIKIGCREDVFFYTDLEILTHIVLNLLSNSIDAVTEGGTIEINCDSDGKYLYMDFMDNGSGIDAADLEHIFNPFFTTKKTGEGTGLGLYIAYSEIQKINGEIQVESQLGAGTKFSLKFLSEEGTNA
ncbi:MAG: transporter substrate-binding domain-containing protein [Sedimentibacter sp.]|uniref:transporter substrate-binding domain-containing protein n=1 Tax=Sedimentibacter sp. TaxID=1960295 RepID=UPI0031588D4A